MSGFANVLGGLFGRPAEAASEYGQEREHTKQVSAITDAGTEQIRVAATAQAVEAGRSTFRPRLMSVLTTLTAWYFALSFVFGVLMVLGLVATFFGLVDQYNWARIAGTSTTPGLLPEFLNWWGVLGISLTGLLTFCYAPTAIGRTREKIAGAADVVTGAMPSARETAPPRRPVTTTAPDDGMAPLPVPEGARMHEPPFMRPGR